VKAPCGCTFQSIEPRDVAPGEAIDLEVVEPCRIHEDYAARLFQLHGLRRIADSLGLNVSDDDLRGAIERDALEHRLPARVEGGTER
jgi:hypothetical protein